MDNDILKMKYNPNPKPWPKVKRSWNAALVQKRLIELALKGKYYESKVLKT